MGEQNEPVTNSISGALPASGVADHSISLPAGSVIQATGPILTENAPPQVVPPVPSEEWKTPPLITPAATPPKPELIKTDSPASAPSVTHKTAPLITTAAEKPKSSRIFTILEAFLIALVIVFVLIVSAIFADDKGWVSSGLSARLAILPVSSLWGGLSFDPATASEQMSAAVKAGATFTAAGSFTGYGANVPTVAADATSTTPLKDPLSSNYTFSLTLLQKNFALVRTLKDNGIDVESEYRAVDGDLYVRDNFGASGGAKDVWVKGGAAPSFSATGLKDLLVSTVASSTYVGEETIQGARTYHFQAALRGSDVSVFSITSASAGTSSWKKASGLMEVWVSRATHLPVQLKARLSQKSSAISITTTLSIPDRPTILAAPDGALDPSVGALTSDQHRKADLKAIAQALEKYKAKTGSYPIAATSQRLDQSDSPVATSLAPAYLGAIPSDPASGRYYGYVSNGLTFELSAVLDDANDSEGVKAGARTLYVVKNGSVQ